MFPTDWPTKADTVDGGSTMVRVRVEVKGKGVARCGAALCADDLPADQMSTSAEDDANTTPEQSAVAATDRIMEDAGEAAQSAQPTEQPMAGAMALGRVTSEVPRGAARGAAASALCSSAALQHLRWGCVSSIDSGIGRACSWFNFGPIRPTIPWGQRSHIFVQTCAQRHLLCWQGERRRRRPDRWEQWHAARLCAEPAVICQATCSHPPLCKRRQRLVVGLGRPSDYVTCPVQLHVQYVAGGGS